MLKSLTTKVFLQNRRSIPILSSFKKKNILSFNYCSNSSNNNNNNNNNDDQEILLLLKRVKFVIIKKYLLMINIY